MASSAVLKFILLGEDRTGAAFGAAGKKMTGLQKGALGVATATAAVAAGMISAGKAAAEDQKSQVVLAKALTNTTGASKAQVSAVEEWISAQGLALGVADDQLRPALARLARSTGDVGKAQALASLAMDASAGTGKGLSTITDALGKAYDGNVGALGRLGIKTKDAAGNTLTFEQIAASMADTFKGQASAAADTLSGKVDRLALVGSETKEALGAGLLPVAESLGDVMLTDVVPAVTKASNWFASLDDGTRTAAVGAVLAVGGFLATAVAVSKVASAMGTARDVAKGLHTAWQVGYAIARVYTLSALDTAKALAAQGVSAAKTAATWISSHVSMAAASAQKAAATVAGNAAEAATWLRNTAAMVAHRVAMVAVSAATKAMAAAQWLLNAAMTANPIGLVIAAIALLGAGLVIAWKKSETFRNIVTGVFSGIQRGVLTLAGIWLSGMRILVDSFLGFVGAAVSGAAKAFGWVPGVGPKLRDAAAKFETFRSTVSGKFDGAIGKVNEWKRNLDKVDGKTVTANVKVDISQAQRETTKIRTYINGVTGKTVTIRVNQVRTTTGKIIDDGRAGGGLVTGPGTATSDSIPMMLSNGEYVIRAAAVRRLGLSTLDALNAGSVVRGFGATRAPTSSGGVGGNTYVINVNGGFATKYEIAATVRDAVLDVERKTGRPMFARG